MRTLRPLLAALLIVTGFSLAPPASRAQQAAATAAPVTPAVPLELPPASTPPPPAAPPDAHAAWLDSDPADTFRRRVILLALLHDESAGIDPKGYLVKTRKMGGPIRENCWRVQVVTSLEGQEVRRDIVTACK